MSLVFCYERSQTTFVFRGCVNYGKVILFFIMIIVQGFLLSWNTYIVCMPITAEMMPLKTARVLELECSVAKKPSEDSGVTCSTAATV